MAIVLLLYYNVFYVQQCLENDNFYLNVDHTSMKTYLYFKKTKQVHPQELKHKKIDK